MKKLLKQLLLILVLTAFTLNIWPNDTFAATTVYVNERASVPISVSWSKPGAGFYKLSTGQNGTVGNPLSGDYVTSFSTNAVFTPNSVGTQKITLTLDISDSGANIISVPAKTIEVKVVNKPAPKPAPAKPKPSAPVIDNTEKEKQEQKAPEKTAEEIEREELAERMKTPLIREIGIVSNSERLNGEKLNTIEPESEKFEYSAVLPRNVNEIKLEIRPSQEDVELIFDEIVSIEEGQDSVELVIKAVQDKLEQEFTLVLSKPEESKFVMERDTKQLRLIVDPYLDEAMTGLGFEKNLINTEDASLGFYFTNNDQDFVIVADDENNAYTYLLDEEKNPTREVFLVTNNDNEVSMLVNEVLGENDGRLFNENGYEDHEIEISQNLTSIDPTIKFNNIIGGWTYDEDSIITHGLTSEGEVELVHLSELNEVKSAFVSFDREPDNSIYKWIYLGFGLWIVTLIAFIVYAIVKSRKSKEDEIANIYD